MDAIAIYCLIVVSIKRYFIAMAKHHGIMCLRVIANTQNNQLLMMGVLAVKIMQRK